jgi:hypothetical protein
MQSIFGHKHNAPANVEEIIFEADRTVIVCEDGIKYGMATVTYDGTPIDLGIFIEMYGNDERVEGKAYLN